MPTHLPLALNSTSSSLLELEVRANAKLMVTMTEGTARGMDEGAMVIPSLHESTISNMAISLTSC